MAGRPSASGVRSPSRWRPHMGWWAIWKGRSDFDGQLRDLQVKLAIGLCGIALFLALPIVDFGAISTQSQLARLDRASVAPEEFDWRALAFDFGPEGRKALQRMKREGNPLERQRAETALRAKSRWKLDEASLAAGPAPRELS